MNNLIEEVISKYSMCKKGDNIIIALSGGADSVCLLHNFISLKEKYCFNIMACHLNHSLRGDESDADMNFCINLCRDFNVELFLKKVDVHALSESCGIGCEEAGRNARYEFFDFLSKKYNAKIATAHNADDNLETTVYNLARGTLLRGLSGIPKIRGNIIRPLICTSRKEIESYCAYNGLSFVTDSTNLADDFNRNKIRHKVVPCLKEINPSVEKIVLRMNGKLSEIGDFLEKSAKELLDCTFCEGRGYKSSMIAKAHRVVQSEAAAILLRNSGYSAYSSKNLDDIINIIHHGGKVMINKEITAVNKQGYFRVVVNKNSEKTVVDKPVRLANIDFANKQNYKYVYKNRVFILSNVKINQKIIKSSSKHLIKSGIISGNLELRTRRSGDRFVLPSRGVSKSLKKLLNELKIPEEKRDSLLLLARENEVLWLESVGASAEAMPEENMEDVILISVGEINE